MPEPTLPIILPPRNSSSASVGTIFGSASEPITIIYCSALVVNGVSVATLSSPAFTGIPTAPTAVAGTSTTQIATTAFVAQELASGIAASAITSGTLVHERGGLEANVSAYNGLVKISGGTTSAVTITTAGEALLDDASAAAQRTTLGLVIGTDVQAYDADLAAIAGISRAKGDLIAGSSSAWDRLPVGTNGQVLVADSAQTLGVKWGTPGTAVATDGSTAITGFQEIKGINLTDDTERTISGGAITRTQTWHTVDTEADAASDLLTRIDGGSTGDILILRAESASRTVTFDHGADNIECQGNVDFSLEDYNDVAFCLYDGAIWRCVKLGSGDVADDSITYAKLQNISATSRILGRKTSGAGDAEECTLSEILDFIGSAARGDILVRGASSWSRLAIGTSGYVLSSNGTDPSWAAVSSGTGVYRNIWIPAGGITPRITNGPAMATVETSGNDITLDVLDFDTTTEEGATFAVAFPDEWDRSTIKCKVYWTATGGSGGVAWGLRSVAISNDDVLDATYGTEQVVTDTLIAANDLHVTDATAAITVGGSPALGDLVAMEITREVANGSDTIAQDVRLIGVMIQYKESSSTVSIW